MKPMQRAINIAHLIILSFLSGLLFGQEGLDLQQCIDYALENNLRLCNSKLNEDIAAEKTQQAYRNLLPSVNASASGRYKFGRSIDDNTNTYINENIYSSSYGLNSSVTLFDGFQQKNAIQFQKYKQQASISSHQKEIDELVFEVIQAFYDLVYYTEMTLIAEQQVQVSTMKLNQVEKQTNLGLKAKTDILEMKANLQSEELTMLRMSNSVKASEMQLKELLNFPPDKTLTIQYQQTNEIELNSLYTLDDYIAKISIHPAIQIAKYNVDARKKAWAIQKANLSPYLSASAGLGSGFYETAIDEAGNTLPFKEQFQNNLSKNIALSLRIPIFNRWSARTSITIAKIEYQQSVNQFEQEKQTLLYLVANEIQNYEALEKEYAKYLEQLEVNDQAFAAAQKKLDHGLVTVLDFYVAKNRQAQSQAEKLRTKLQLSIKYKLLQYYQGERFWETNINN